MKDIIILSLFVFALRCLSKEGRRLIKSLSLLIVAGNVFALIGALICLPFAIVMGIGKLLGFM